MELWVFDRNLKADFEAVMEKMAAVLGANFVASLAQNTSSRFFVAYRDTALNGGRMNWRDVADNSELIDFLTLSWHDTVRRANAAQSIPDFRWNLSVSADVKAALARLDGELKVQET